MYNAGQVTKAGAPVDGMNAVQSLAITGSPTGGTFTLTFGGQTTAAIPYNATAAQVQAALLLLSTIAPRGVVCTGGPLPGTVITITFVKELGGLPQSTITSTDSLTGGSSPATAVTSTTTGVRGSFRSVPAGWTLVDTTNSRIYQQTGPPEKPVWVEPSIP